MEYADLAIIDISKTDTEEVRAALAIEVREALHDHGFFYVVNHGYSQAQVMKFLISCELLNDRFLTQTTRMFDIANVPFSGVNDSEKESYLSTRLEDGSVQGYILLKYTVSNPTHDYLIYASHSNSAYRRRSSRPASSVCQ